MAYGLLSKNVASESVNGFKVGQILYLYHVRGKTAQEIMALPNLIKSILKGFDKQSRVESYEVYDIAMYMIEHESETLEKMYSMTVTK